MDLIPLFQEQFGQIGAVLAGNAGDQGLFRVPTHCALTSVWAACRAEFSGFIQRSMAPRSGQMAHSSRLTPVPRLDTARVGKSAPIANFACQPARTSVECK